MTNDLDIKYVIRPAINFGNDLLLSGDIIAEEDVQTLVRGNYYTVSIEMQTVEDEAYEAIQDLVRVGNAFLIQSASKVIGKGMIKELIYM